MTTMTIQEQIAVMQAAAKGKRIQQRLNGLDNWSLVDKPLWNWFSNNYRVDPTDVDMVKAPLDRSVFEGRPVWIRDQSNNKVNSAHLITCISDQGIYSFGSTLGTWQSLMDRQMEYTLDCKTWLPCHKLVPAS